MMLLAVTFWEGTCFIVGAVTFAFLVLGLLVSSHAMEYEDEWESRTGEGGRDRARRERIRGHECHDPWAK